MKSAPLFARLIALLCLATPQLQAAQDPPPPAPARPTLDQAAARALTAQALARDPNTLPRAEESRWSQWGPKDPVAPELQAALAAGMRAYSAGDYASSLVLLFALLEHEPEYPPALYQGGLCYFRLRRYGDAAVLLERFVHVAPQEIGATQALGHCYYSLGDFERAREHYGKVLAESPKSPEALRGLALSELRLGNAERALQLLGTVLELRPDHADAHAWCAQILFDQGDSQAALPHAERVRDLQPWDPRGWFLLSRILGDLGRDSDADAARVRFETTSRVDQQVRQQEGTLLHDPSRPDAWAQLVALQRSVGHRAAVGEAAVRLAALRPTDSRTALLVVDAFEWLGDKPRAKQAALYAESVAGTEAAAWEWLAEFYRRSADATSAERAAKAAQAGH